VLGLALALSSCLTISDWSGDPGAPRVAVIGDSLVFLSERSDSVDGAQMITDELVANGLQAWVTGWIGLTVDFAYPVVWNDQSRADLAPDVVVIALGTNDMAVDPASGATAATIDDARLTVRAWLDEVRAACVRLIGPAESVTEWGLDITSPAWNAMLTEEAERHPDARFVPWEPLSEWTDGGRTPHMTPEGQAAYRDLIVSEAVECAG
jgi:lysophospholipase L1-like esterase